MISNRLKYLGVTGLWFVTTALVFFGFRMLIQDYWRDPVPPLGELGALIGALIHGQFFKRWMATIFGLSGDD